MSDSDDIFKFGFSSGWLAHSRYEELLSKQLNVEFVTIAEAFKSNMMRVRNLGALVPDIAFWTRIRTRLADVANYRLGRAIDLPGRVRGAPLPDTIFLDEIERVAAEWDKPPSGEAWEDGGDIVKMWANQYPDYIGNGLETLMSAKLLETWAAVEALIIDAWTIAVNLMPSPLATNILTDDKSFSVGILRAYDFKLDKSMGNIIRRHSGKLNFNSLSGLKKIYKETFVDANTDEIFAAFEPDIDHLEAIRHLFAHRSGKIDEKFLNKFTRSEYNLDYAIGDQLKLDGNMISNYTHKSVDFAANMLVFVDRWIYAHRSH